MFGKIDELSRLKRLLTEQYREVLKTWARVIVLLRELEEKYESIREIFGRDGKDKAGD